MRDIDGVPWLDALECRIGSVRRPVVRRNTSRELVGDGEVEREEGVGNGRRGQRGQRGDDVSLPEEVCLVNEFQVKRQTLEDGGVGEGVVFWYANVHVHH